MGDLKNEFGWSASRGRLFSRCRRAYWYRYYGMWNGWDRRAHVGRQIAYRLSKMNSVVPWGGNLVHDVLLWAETRIAKGVAVTLDEVKAKMRADMVKGWRQARGTDWATRPKQNVNLSEIYYEGETEAVVAKASTMRARATGAVEAWFDLAWPELLASLKREQWVELESLSKIRFRNEVDIWVQPDLAFWREDLLNVVDWKTGTPKEADERQVMIYVIWAMKRNVPLSKIQATLVYINDGGGVEKSLRFDVSEMREFADSLWDEIEEVRKSLVNREFNVAKAEDFPMRESEDWVCSSCEYRQLCYGSRDYPGPARVGDPVRIAPPEEWR